MSLCKLRARSAERPDRTVFSLDKVLQQMHSFKLKQSNARRRVVGRRTSCTPCCHHMSTNLQQFVCASQSFVVCHLCWRMLVPKPATRHPPASRKGARRPSLSLSFMLKATSLYEWEFTRHVVISATQVDEGPRDNGSCKDLGTGISQQSPDAVLPF